MWRASTEWRSVHTGKGFLACLVFTVGCGSLAGSPDTESISPWQLEVRRADQSLVAAVVLPADGVWCMGWNHSVAGFPVSDCYGVADGTLRLESSHQPDFAAGLGHIEGRGRMESDGEGGYRILDINESVPGNAYWLRVGALTVNHRIVTDDNEVSLSALAAGERVEVRLVKRLPDR
ncbi:MAG: DUF1850 domain-containing protein [Natronospirillum sp.]